MVVQNRNADFFREVRRGEEVGGAGAWRVSLSAWLLLPAPFARAFSTRGRGHRPYPMTKRPPLMLPIKPKVLTVFVVVHDDLAPH